MNIVRTIALLCLTTSLTACAGMEEEEDIALSEVPAAAIAAAEGAVDGLEIKAAEAEDKNGRTIYEIKGTANGVRHEVKVTAEGDVLKTEAKD